MIAWENAPPPAAGARLRRQGTSYARLPHRRRQSQPYPGPHPAGRAMIALRPLALVAVAAALLSAQQLKFNLDSLAGAFSPNLSTAPADS